jgi:hypothetical protein
MSGSRTAQRTTLGAVVASARKHDCPSSTVAVANPDPWRLDTRNLLSVASPDAISTDGI